MENLKRLPSKPPLITPSASPPVSRSFFPPPYRIPGSSPPFKRQRTSFLDPSNLSASPASSISAQLKDPKHFHDQRQASTLRMLDVWSSLADRYTRSLDEDDIIDITTGKLVKDRGVIRGETRIREFGPLADLVDEGNGDEGHVDEVSEAVAADSEYEAEGEDEDDIDELDTLTAVANQRNRERTLPPVVIQGRVVPPVQVMNPADAEDLREFIEAERKRREEFGSDGETNFDSQLHEEDDDSSCDDHNDVENKSDADVSQDEDESEDELNLKVRDYESSSTKSDDLDDEGHDNGGPLLLASSSPPISPTRSITPPPHDPPANTTLHSKRFQSALASNLTSKRVSLNSRRPSSAPTSPLIPPQLHTPPPSQSLSSPTPEDTLPTSPLTTPLLPSTSGPTSKVPPTPKLGPIHRRKQSSTLIPTEPPSPSVPKPPNSKPQKLNETLPVLNTPPSPPIPRLDLTKLSRSTSRVASSAKVQVVSRRSSKSTPLVKYSAPKKRLVPEVVIIRPPDVSDVPRKLIDDELQADHEATAKARPQRGSIISMSDVHGDEQVVNRVASERGDEIGEPLKLPKPRRHFDDEERKRRKRKGKEREQDTIGLGMTVGTRKRKRVASLSVTEEEERSDFSISAQSDIENSKYNDSSSSKHPRPYNERHRSHSNPVVAVAPKRSRSQSHTLPPHTSHCVPPDLPPPPLGSHPYYLPYHSQPPYIPPHYTAPPFQDPRAQYIISQAMQQLSYLVPWGQPLSHPSHQPPSQSLSSSYQRHQVHQPWAPYTPTHHSSSSRPTSPTSDDAFSPGLYQTPKHVRHGHPWAYHPDPTFSRGTLPPSSPSPPPSSSPTKTESQAGVLGRGKAIVARSQSRGRRVSFQIDEETNGSCEEQEMPGNGRGRSTQNGRVRRDSTPSPVAQNRKLKKKPTDFGSGEVTPIILDSSSEQDVDSKTNPVRGQTPGPTSKSSAPNRSQRGRSRSAVKRDEEGSAKSETEMKKKGSGRKVR